MPQRAGLQGGRDRGLLGATHRNQSPLLSRLFNFETTNGPRFVSLTRGSIAAIGRAPRMR